MKAIHKAWSCSVVDNRDTRLVLLLLLLLRLLVVIAGRSREMA
jgi:hypothetical protein